MKVKHSCYHTEEQHLLLPITICVNTGVTKGVRQREEKTESKKKRIGEKSRGGGSSFSRKAHINKVLFRELFIVWPKRAGHTDGHIY